MLNLNTSVNWLTATASDSDNNTSEFSVAVSVPADASDLIFKGDFEWSA